MAKALTSAIRITGAGPFTRIEVDGVDVSNDVLAADLRLRPGGDNTLELKVFQAESVEVEGQVVYIAYASGVHAKGRTPIEALEKLLSELRASEPNQ